MSFVSSKPYRKPHGMFVLQYLKIFKGIEAVEIEQNIGYSSL